MNQKTKNIIILIILFIAIAGVILPKELNDLDEIWNYNFARCIANGLLPYKDFNMVQTPLLPIICGITLKLTLNELIVMRILGIMLMTACSFVTYKIFESLNIHKYIINIYVISIYLLLYKYFCIDYNYAVLLITLITIYIELKHEVLEVDFKKDFWLGILVGTSILFKQTTGLVLTAIFVFYKLLLVSNKYEIQRMLKMLIYRIIGSIIPILFLTIYLSINYIWSDFLDYTVYSIKTFSNKVPYILLIIGKFGIIMQILSIIVPITILVMYYLSVIKEHKTKEQKNIFILFSYSVASMIVVYPISDKIHFLIAALPSLIAVCYLTYLLINNIIKLNIIKIGLKIFLRAFSLLSISAILLVSIINLITYLKNANIYNNLQHFKYIPINNENIFLIDSFIIQEEYNGNTVYILDASAAIYMIPIDKYNKDYDMFLKGNIGSRGEEGLIKKIQEEKENTIFLIKNDNYKRNWQTPETVINYIKTQWKKSGQISVFDIYHKI